MEYLIATDNIYIASCILNCNFKIWPYWRVCTTIKW